jgi:hypothetical protein
MCLRLAACAALRGATLAGDKNVFDSRIGAIDWNGDEGEDAVAAAITVYTEEDSGDALGVNGGPPFKPEIELCLEIAMCVKHVEGEEILVAHPTTDDELEMSIDLIEAQAELALFRSNAPLGVLFRKVAKKPLHKQSIRFVDAKGGEKAAARYVTFKIEIDDNEVPIYDASLTDLDRLPEPFRTIAKAWPAGVEKDRATAIAAALPGTTPPALEGIDVTTSGGLVEARTKDGITGNGVLALDLESPVLTGATSGTYKIIFVSPTGFTVSDPSGAFVAPGLVGTPFANQVQFILHAGSIAFVAGDEFDILVPLNAYDWTL